MKLHPMWQNYPQLVPELNQTIELMEQSVKLKNKAVEKAVLDMIHSGGKLLRPAYQLLFSQFGTEQDRKKAICLAAAIEMLHTATLIHDDIIDEADIRRKLPTIRKQFDNSTAVYAGDYLLISCFKLLADYTQSMRSLQLNSRSMEKILDGELGQMNDRYQIDVTIDDYLENISGKTAYLLGDNEFKLPHVGVMDHAIEFLALLSGCAGNTFIGVDLIEFPIRLSVYVLFEIPLLRFKGICLVVLVRGDAAIACYWNH